MGDKFIAKTQYGDLLGTAAFDGHEHPPLHELAERTDMPADKYWPIGFQLCRLDFNDEGKIPFTVVALNRKEIGLPDIKYLSEVAKQARKTGELPVYSFDGHLARSDFPVLFKRIDIKAVCKALKDVNIVSHHPSRNVL